MLNVHHTFGFKQHPLEDAGLITFMYLCDSHLCSDDDAVERVRQRMFGLTAGHVSGKNHGALKFQIDA